MAAMRALALLLAALCAAPRIGADVQSACRNALAVGDPLCLHGGTLHANSESAPTSCAYCDCPPGWGGIDCALCRDVDSCPPQTNAQGETLQATGCTAGSLVPSAEELAQGKLLSCACGGDAATEQLCQLLPETRIRVALTAGADGTSQQATLRLYAGMPSQDAEPNTTQYAYPAYWSADFTTCAWSEKPCLDPLPSTEQCLFFTCPTAAVACPPPDVPPCPGYNTFPYLCDPDANGVRPYQHHCNPLIVPSNSSMQFYCSTRSIDGVFLCYFRQPMKAAIALQCSTGNCVYGNAAPPPTPSTPQGFWTGEMVTLLGMSLVVLCLLSAAALLLHFDSSRSAAHEPMDDGSASQMLLDGHDADAAVAGEEEHVWPHVLSWRDVSCATFARAAGGRRIKLILDGICGLAGPPSEGEERPGLFAILGPSGAGKSTLLDILAGRKGAGYVVRGSVQLNGADADARALRRASGYVPQDDVLPGTSTVWEYLAFHAELRLPRGMARDARQQRVRRTLAALGLSRQADALIGDQFQRGLSGGEKRRVSIAAELITQPGLLFLDEPTTGLDSTNAAKVVDILASLAAGGVTVLLSIHQPRPDIFRLLARVLVLSGAGQMVYSGPASLAEAHFGSMGHALPDKVHIADFMLDTVLRAPPEDVSHMVASFRSSEVQGANALLAERVRLQLSYRPGVSAASAPHASQGKYTAGFWLQLRVLCGRLLRNAYRHPFLFWLHFAATAAVALCLGAVFRHAGVDTGGIQNRLGALFFMLLYLSFISLGSLPVWHEERLLFARERAAGAYGANAYFAAVVLFDILPLRVLPPLFFLSSYALIGLRAGCAACLARFALVLMLGSVAASSLCMAIGAFAPSNAVANVCGSIALLSASLFGGFLVQRDDLPPGWRWLAVLSPINHAFEALAVNEFHGATGFAFTSRVAPDARVDVTGDQVLATFGFRTSWPAFVADVQALLALALSFLALAYTGLRTRGVA